MSISDQLENGGLIDSRSDSKESQEEFKYDGMC